MDRQKVSNSKPLYNSIRVCLFRSVTHEAWSLWSMFYCRCFISFLFTSYRCLPKFISSLLQSVDICLYVYYDQIFEFCDDGHCQLCNMGHMSVQKWLNVIHNFLLCLLIRGSPTQFDYESLSGLTQLNTYWKNAGYSE